MKNKRLLLLTAYFLLFFSCCAFADMSFKPGVQLRLRHELWKNIFDLENSSKDNRN